MEKIRLEILREALGAGGADNTFRMMDNPLVNELCAIIGSLHRLVKQQSEGEHGKPMSDEQIEEWIKASV